MRSAPVLPLSEQILKFPCTYSDILHDCGYSSAENLRAAVKGWLKILDEVRPQRLLADHSPTALLASRIHSLKTAAIGTGFLCPPNISPLPSLRLEIPAPHWADVVEQTVLDNLNQVLRAHNCKPLDRVAELFAPPVERSFRDGRRHSFRHYFCSTCANRRIPERVLIRWMGHAKSDMIHEDESLRQMSSINFTSDSPGLSAGGKHELKPQQERAAKQRVRTTR